MNTYKYSLIDLSLLLSRNVYACFRSADKKVTPGDVVKMTLQTVNKIARDYRITSDKVILLADTWDPDFGGYYRTWLLGGNYKDSRTWMTPESLAALKSDPKSSPADIKKAERELEMNQVKNEAKAILRTQASRIGLPCIGVPGLEYDDLCYIISSLLYASGEDKKSVIVTKDSDCMYCTSPVVDYFRLPVAGSDPVTLSYQEIYTTEVPEALRQKGLGLWDYKAIWDSLDGGHNDLRRTRRQRTNLTKVIQEVVNGDYGGVTDKDLFLRQYGTFKLETFPMISEAVSEITSKLPTIGHLGDLSEFHDFCNSLGISGVSDDYYRTFITRFSQKLYTE